MTSRDTNSTPHKAAVAGYQQHRQVLADAATLQKEYGKDMAGNWVGPFTLPKFFGLMPIAKQDLDRMPQDVEFPDQDSDDSVDAKREKHLYKVFVRKILLISEASFLTSPQRLAHIAGEDHQRVRPLAKLRFLHRRRWQVQRRRHRV